MTYEQWDEISKFMKSYYGKFKHFLSEKRERNVWYGYFQRMDYDMGMKAVNMCFAKCNYPPTLQQIMETYNELTSERQAYSKQVYEIYREMETYYPMSLRDDGRIEAFKAVLKDVKPSEIMSTARLIHNRVIGRVKDAERGDIDNLPVLSECIRECADGASRSGDT